MEDLKKKINFDPGFLYYPTPNDRTDGITKGSGFNVVQETYNSSNRKHICAICGKRFFTQNSLKTHMEHHPTDKPVNANLEKEDNTDWKNRFVINKGISCVKNNCNFIALDSVDYSKHTANCEGIRFTKENCSSYCELCDCYYSSENYFKAHSILQHPENGPNISLEDNDQKSTKISDPVSLYVSEKNCEKERSSITSASPSMYPDSLVSKKKLKSLDLETSTINTPEVISTGMTNENDMDISAESTVKEAVEILKTTIAADSSQIMNEISTEIYSENELELRTIEEVVDDILISSAEVSTKILDSENVHEERPPVENNSPEIHSQTTPATPNPVDVSNAIIEFDSPIIEPTEGEPSTVAENPNDEIQNHVGLQVLSEICESLSSKNLSMTDCGLEAVESNNSHVSCDKLERPEEDGIQLSTERADVTTDGSEVNNISSITDSNEKNSLADEKPPLNHPESAPSSPPKAAEYHVLLEAAARLGDELSSFSETYSTDNEINKSNRTVESEKSESIQKNISQLETNLDSSKCKDIRTEKTEKNEKPVKKIIEFDPDDSNYESESDDPSDTKQPEKHEVPARSKFIPKKTNSKSYQKIEKHRKTMKREENDRFMSRTPFTSGNSEVQQNHESESLDSDNLNVKQRSVRQRKKLMLPDFEYSLENKGEFSDSSTNDNPYSMGDGDGEQPKKKKQGHGDGEQPKKKKQSHGDGEQPKKKKQGHGDGEPKKKKETRGRPRKKVVDDSNSKTSNVDKKVPPTVTNKKSNILSSTSKKYSKTFCDNDEQSEEFSLNTTMNESECDAGYDDLYAADVSLNDSKLERIIQEEDDDPSDDIHSWLKKVDFSEQTSITSWCENQPKKKGRPRKSKNIETLKKPPKTFPTKVEIAPKSSTVCNGDSKQVIIKKKKGRPLLKGKPTIIQQPNKQETVSMKDTKVEENDETHPADISPRKRGRPCKVKVDDKSPNSMQSPKVADAANNQTVEVAAAKVTCSKNPDDVEKVTDKKSNKSNAAKTETIVRPDDSPSQIVLVRKRGRPRKSIASSGEDDEISKTSNVGLKSDKPPAKPGETVIENIETNQPALIETSTCSMDHLSASVTETDLSKTDLPKTDLSDTSSLEGTHRKRGRPLKKRKLLLGRMKANIPSKSVRSSDVAMNSMDENKDSPSQTDEISDVKQKDLTDKVHKKTPRRHSKPTLWKKKTLEQNVPVSPEITGPDETLRIDEALYHADLRNKSKYSKVFKKVPVTMDNSTADNLVVCGRCQKKMTNRHYLRYHRISHYYLCWLEDEPEINLSDDAELNKILQSYVNPEALRKKAIRLACERCDKVMKSVVGYVSHVRFCQKVDENELLEKCTLCPRALKPSSIRHHYIKYHGVTKFAPTNDSKLIPVAFMQTKKDTICKEDEELIHVTVRNTQMGYEKTPVQKVDILNDEDFWKSLKTSYDLYMCMGLSCKHMTLGKDDLKSHILSCSATFCEFSCLCCPFITKYETEMIYHAKRKCKELSDSEDNAEEKPASDRRVSRRVKKRKFVVDYNDYVDVDTSKKAKKAETEDEDFTPPAEEHHEEDNDSSESESVELKEKPISKKADILLNKTVEENGLRNAFIYHPTTRSSDPLGWTVDTRLGTFATSPTLMNLRVDINEWETFPISDFLKYSPIQHKSPKVSFDGSPFVQLKVFDSDLIKGVPVSYTGGPVWSMAWAPLPAHVTEQYLAVAGLQHMNHVVNVETSVEFASIVQIWKYGSLDNISNDIHAPTLAWAIAHNYGAVWGMEWCPTGGFDNSSTPCRLGILALATSSGCIAVYSMPRLDCGGETRSIVANPEPDLVLKVRIDDVQCTRVVWKRNAVPDTIYGGFSDGTIALWNVAFNSSILKKGKTLYPYRTFEAHPTGITALDVHWLDNCRFMISSAADRILKFWDLDDLSGPMYEHELTNIPVSAAWMHHWVVAALGSDFLNAIESTSSIFNPRELSEKKRPILNIKDTFWSVAYSDWNDAVATSSNGGCVFVYAAKHLSALSYKQPEFEKVVTQTLLVPLSEEEKIQSESVEADTGLPPINDSCDCSSFVKNYGIKFCDRLKTKPSSEVQNFDVKKGNIVSVNKVCWNQNYNSFNWLALGYDCGFVRVIRVERFDKCHLTKFYKLNENSTITLV